MNQISNPHRLRKVKAVLPGSLKSADGGKTSSSDPVSPPAFRRVLRILLRSPWDDYEYIKRLDRVIFAKHRVVFFKLVDVRQFDCDDMLEQFQNLSKVQHPNVAPIYDIYRDGEQTFLVMEHLGIPMSQLDIGKYELEEWEIATIISEVWKPHTSQSMLTIADSQGCSAYCIAETVLYRALL